ncbi:excinuclease ABC subunit UvrC [Prevotella sp. kh1p2]|uniref:excinuclease ABC subunit UvrC n=1 Tax=Prevotella sp. kh1p2 TaxID=1761883 RepID=UPI0008B7044A|nr:excinuclease ABC subunit UvrC [Prevotella sp. kh1p2]SES70021.1 Excinuclease ABC subunit C [Prevotella sp. kh1p2]SNU10344.1 Excinuclease ABC subunit C [Prevotellaceae bacterium KH2P17]
MTKEENEQRLAYLKNIVLNMPEVPGSYQFKDETGTIIYVGKAKNLKRRVSSYFLKEVDRFKTKVLVSKIRDISYFTVKTEEDALLLENSLIKKYNPKYNVLLKDGKTYPSIVVTKEYLPRIFKTRNINKKNGTYYGPFPHISAMYNVLDIINRVFKPRRCHFPITREGIAAGKYKTCLEYHLHNCMAPCVGKQSYEDYQENIRQAREVLKGNTRELGDWLYKLMEKNAEMLRFEQAEALKQRYILLREFVAKSEVVSHTITDVDVFSITDDELRKHAFINYIHVTNGTINQSFTYEYKRKLDETDEDLLLTAIPEIRERFGSHAKEVIVPFEMDWKLKDAEFFIPQRGDKKHLLELSEMNGKQYKFDRLKQAEKLNPEQKHTRLMKELQNKLKLSKLPYQIECFDNSNISGTDAVAGCIVYKGMKPSRKDYRKYNIKTVSGPDDYASMQEVVRRRYSRMIEEQTPLPDLIITDGGKGQMEVVREVVEDELKLSIPIAGLAKDDRHRTNELLFGFPPRVIGLKTDSELFHVLTQIQDEVHRYAITFHRDKRSKHALHSELDDIKGIGPKTRDLLLQKLKSVKKIKEADNQLLTDILGTSKGNLVYAHFHPTEPAPAV